MSASSAHAAPQAVKTWTAKAATVSGVMARRGAWIGSIGLSTAHRPQVEVRQRPRVCNLSVIANAWQLPATITQGHPRTGQMTNVSAVGAKLDRRGGRRRRRAGWPRLRHRARRCGRRHARHRTAGGADNRTTALLAGSVTALQTLGVWQRCLPHAAPLRKIRIVDDTARLLRAPEVRFDAAEIGLDAFGHNIENRHLLARARSARRGAEASAHCRAGARGQRDECGVTIKHADGTVRALLVIGADGQRSLCRAAAGSARHGGAAYPQTALTLNLGHARPHEDTSTEFHTESGPFTLVPLPGRRSSLVWVLDPQTAEHLTAMTAQRLRTEIEHRAHSLLGRMSVEPGRGIFRLLSSQRSRLARARIALVGEAAHVLPPIGAQGLNLGLRDSATIAEIVADARRQQLRCRRAGGARPLYMRSVGPTL